MAPVGDLAVTAPFAWVEPLAHRWLASLASLDLRQRRLRRLRRLMHLGSGAMAEPSRLPTLPTPLRTCRCRAARQALHLFRGSFGVRRTVARASEKVRCHKRSQSHQSLGKRLRHSAVASATPGGDHVPYMPLLGLFQSRVKSRLAGLASPRSTALPLPPAGVLRPHLHLEDASFLGLSLGLGLISDGLDCWSRTLCCHHKRSRGA